MLSFLMVWFIYNRHFLQHFQEAESIVALRMYSCEKYRDIKWIYPIPIIRNIFSSGKQ